MNKGRVVKKKTQNRKGKPAKEAGKTKQDNYAKVVRDSFTMPIAEHEQLKLLKKLCLARGVHIKKGELLRAGIMALVAMDEADLLALLEKVEKVKTGRPARNNSDKE